MEVSNDGCMCSSLRYTLAPHWPKGTFIRLRGEGRWEEVSGGSEVATPIVFS